MALSVVDDSYSVESGAAVTAGRAAPLPAWRTAMTAGSIANLSATNSRADLDPSADALANPNHPSAADWNASRSWTTVTDYCGSVFASGLGAYGTLLQYTGAGHVAVNPLMWLGFDLSDLTWKRIGERPPPTNALNGLTYPGGTPDWTTWKASGSNAAFDETWGDWDADSALFAEAFRRTSGLIPEGSHTRNRMVYRPPSAAGNAAGEVHIAWHATGVQDSTAVGTSHKYNASTGVWSRHANKPSAYGGAYGGLLYHPQLDVITGVNANMGASAYGLDVFDCGTEVWTQRTFTAGGRSHAADNTCFAWTDTNGDQWHIVCEHAASLSAPMTMYGVKVQDLIAGTGMAWTTLTVSAASWPVADASFADGIPGYSYTVTWAPCAADDCFYAVNRVHGSDKLWKLTPPGSGLIGGTWTISEQTLTGQTLSAQSSNGTRGVSWDYSRLQWVPALSVFIWTGNRLDAPVQAILPQGL